MNTNFEQLHFLFVTCNEKQYKKILDADRLFIQSGVITTQLNGLHLPTDLQIDTISNGDIEAGVFPVHQKFYQQITDISSGSLTKVYDAAYCIGSPYYPDFDVLANELLPCCKCIYLSQHILYQWELLLGNCDYFLHRVSLDNTSYYQFDTLLFLNHYITESINTADYSAVLDILSEFAPLVATSYELSTIGAKIAYLTRNDSLSAIYEEQANRLSSNDK